MVRLVLSCCSPLRLALCCLWPDMALSVVLLLCCCLTPWLLLMGRDWKLEEERPGRGFDWLARLGGASTPLRGYD